jgi:hypothetical protein
MNNAARMSSRWPNREERAGGFAQGEGRGLPSSPMFIGCLSVRRGYASSVQANVSPLRKGRTGPAPVATSMGTLEGPRRRVMRASLGGRP